MTKHGKTLEAILRGASDATIEFESLRSLLQRLGFQERISGSHHIFSKDGIAELINLQPLGASAKSYQVKQTRDLILKYKLEIDSK